MKPSQIKSVVDRLNQKIKENGLDLIVYLQKPIVNEEDIRSEVVRLNELNSVSYLEVRVHTKGRALKVEMAKRFVLRVQARYPGCLGKSRIRRMAYVRKIMSYYMKHTFGLSLTDIGKLINRHHATVHDHVHEYEKFHDYEDFRKLADEIKSL